ncbi:hypothetical protein ES703_58156 [subsurface metagenome]
MAKKKRNYVFPTPSKCPRCRGMDTVAYRTDGKTQYRRCRRAVCLHRYYVIGIPIKKENADVDKKKKQETIDGSTKLG